MRIIYVIGGTSPEYEGWLRIGKLNKAALSSSQTNGDVLRLLVKQHVDQYMLPAGQKYHLYWAEVSKLSLKFIYSKLQKSGVPRYDNSDWFNTDVWTIRKCLNLNLSVNNYRRLKPIDLAKYLDRKYQLELLKLLKHPNNSKEGRFKRDFFNTWQLSSNESVSIQRIVKVFSAYLLLMNLISTVPKGCRKMKRKLIPLNMDDLHYDLKLLDYEFGLNDVIRTKNQINSLKDQPFGTAEFTNSYLIKHVKFLKIFNLKFLNRYFNL